MVEVRTLTHTVFNQNDIHDTGLVTPFGLTEATQLKEKKKCSRPQDTKLLGIPMFIPDSSDELLCGWTKLTSG
jgi:hypothetical protein